VRTKLMMAGGQHRSFRTFVWIGRVIGWALFLVAIIGITRGPQLLVSLGLGLVALAWILGFELFLRFFDLYLSRN